jgi:anti-sigma regulatory factor (Ser/Thr protein kinase)
VFISYRRGEKIVKKVGFIRKNGIFDKISGFFAIYRKGYYNKQKEQSPQDWRRTAMEEGNAKSLVRRLPIKNRITLMVILISVVPILIISIFSYAKAFISVRQTVRAFAAQTLTSLERSLTNLADPSRLLAGGQEKLPEEVLKTEPTGLFQQEALRYLTGVTVLYTDGTVCSLAGEEILAVTESGGWAITQNEVGEQRLAVAWYATDGEGNAYTVQALFMPQMFTRLLDVYNEESCNRLVLVDGAGGLLTDDGTPLTVLEGEVIRQTAFEVSGEPICPREERSSFLCYLTVPALEATLVFIEPYTEMMKPLQSIFFGTLFGTILLLNFSVIVIDSIDRPMNALVKSFGDAARVNFAVTQSDESRDELGILNQAFNEICAEMREALNKVEKEQAEKRRAEIRMLQAQINPHFLFNTLDSLRFTSMMNNVPVVSDGLAALSHLLRSSILKDNSYTPLHSELQTVEDYLTLQRIRCCETIVLKTEISEEAAKASVMRLLLQPIVENAVIHGIKENVPLTIRLKAWVGEETLYISIIDDGKGFDQEKAGEDGVPKSSKMSGIGLHNVKDRLYLSYKDRQSFSIGSVQGQGTEVQMTMPYTEWKEESDV